MSIQLPVGLKCDPVQMAEVVQQEYILVGRARLYPGVNVANTVYLSNHHGYCLQSQNKGRKDMSPERFQRKGGDEHPGDITLRFPSYNVN